MLAVVEQYSQHPPLQICDHRIERRLTRRLSDSERTSNRIGDPFGITNLRKLDEQDRALTAASRSGNM